MVFTSVNHPLDIFIAQLAVNPAVLVQLDSTQGSSPREAGTWMAVFADTLIGTIGGGHLEYEVTAKARALLQKNLLTTPATVLRFALGPSLGQCCGGIVNVRFELVSAEDRPTLAVRLKPNLQPVALFGGGHVGHALVRVLSNLPFALTWIDSREGVFNDGLSANAAFNVVCEYSDPVQDAVRSLAPQSRVVIMSFSHAEDLDVLASCLQRQREKADLPYIGLIGSHTKWATFRHRLEARGFMPAELTHVTCPIGMPGIVGKEPEVIAIAVAAQLLGTLYPL